MMTRIDQLLDGTTMYRLVLMVLAGYLVVATVLAGVGLLPFSPIVLVASASFLLLMCWAANTLLAWAFDVPTNIESAAITALILALILDPATSLDNAQVLGWAAILAMASKYLVAVRRKHIFNPAALAAVISSFALGHSASWWVGTASMLPFVVIGGWLIVHKLRLEWMAGAFFAVALATECCATLIQRAPLAGALWQLIGQAPLIFFATIMLTEPLSMPPTRNARLGYAALVGVLFTPQVHVGALYSTPELALLLGNACAYALSPKQRVALSLRKKTRLARDIVDFVFTPSAKLAYLPGQYMEVTLGHPRADSRGNRRYFTLASSPTEDTVHLGVRFYERGSSFKRALATLAPRSTLLSGQIAGDFTLPRDPAEKLVFIAGGIGITPFRSMLKYLLDTQQRRDIILLYANRAANDIVYKDVLSEAQTKLGVSVVYTLTDTRVLPRGWDGAVGRVDARLIERVVPDYLERTYYLSGPPAMVRAHAHALRELGVRRVRIKRDYFSGLA